MRLALAPSRKHFPPDWRPRAIVSPGIHGRRGRLRRASLDFVSAARVAWPGLGRPGAVVLACHCARSRLKAYLAAWLGGLIFWLLALQWLWLLDVGGLTGWIVMSLVFSCWWPLFLAVARLAVFRLRLPLMMAAPIVWVGLEYGRAYFLSGFPWYYLAHSQFRNLYLIQIADFASSLGISLLIAIVNAMVVDLVMLPLLGRSRQGIRLHRRQYVRLCVVTCLIGTTLCYGAIRVSSARFHDGPRLALLQSNIEQKHKNKGRRRGSDHHRVRGADRPGSGAPRAPDLIVWPETAYPYGFISVDPALEPPTLESQVRCDRPQVVR